MGTNLFRRESVALTLHLQPATYNSGAFVILCFQPEQKVKTFYFGVQDTALAYNKLTIQKNNILSQQNIAIKMSMTN